LAVAVLVGREQTRQQEQLAQIPYFPLLHLLVAVVGVLTQTQRETVGALAVQVVAAAGVYRRAAQAAQLLHLGKVIRVELAGLTVSAVAVVVVVVRALLALPGLVWQAATVVTELQTVSLAHR